MVSLMPWDDQVMFATSEPIEPLGVRGVLEPDVLDDHVDLHALGLADLVACGLDMDIRVVAGDVLHQERRKCAERHAGFVLHHAPGRLGDDLVRAAAGVQLARQQARRDQRDDDDDGQDDRQRIAEQVLDLHQQRRVLVRRSGLRAVRRARQRLARRRALLELWGWGALGCDGGGPGGTWLAGRAQGSVTSAILPYRRT